MENIIDKQVIKNYLESSDWLVTHKVSGTEYNFGFWNYVIKSNEQQQKISFTNVSKKRLFETLEKLGFRKRYLENNTFSFVHEDNNILTIVTPEQIKDVAIMMVKSLPEEMFIDDFKFKSEKLKEIFLKEQSILFTEKSLSALKAHTKPVLTDNPDTMYFPFINGVVKVTNDKIELTDYSKYKDYCIWNNHIIKREFIFMNQKSMFEDFICNVSNNNVDRISNMRIAIGYALHRNYSEANIRAIILYDEELTDSESAHGGNGKTLLVKAINKLRDVVIIDGKRFSAQDKFSLQRVTESTSIVFFDDVTPGFEFERFNSILSNGWEIETKHKKTFFIPLTDSPKMIIASNSILKCKWGHSTERRQFVLEFSDFYSKQRNLNISQPIVHTHGCMFFDGWDIDEWNRFDNYMIESCKFYLEKGLRIHISKNVLMNRLLQETSEEFFNWIKEIPFKPGENYLYSEYYNKFNQEFFLFQSDYVSTQAFTKWLRCYARTKGGMYKTFRHN